MSFNYWRVHNTHSGSMITLCALGFWIYDWIFVCLEAHWTMLQCCGCMENLNHNRPNRPSFQLRVIYWTISFRVHHFRFDWSLHRSATECERINLWRRFYLKSCDHGHWCDACHGRFRKGFRSFDKLVWIQLSFQNSWISFLFIGK